MEMMAVAALALIAASAVTVVSSSSSAAADQLLRGGPSTSCDGDGKQGQQILCLPHDYSKFDLPHRNDFNMIDIGIEISDVLKIDDKDYSITFSLYFNVQWSEPRLNLSRTFFNSENITSDDHLVPVNLELIHDLWVPNIFIYNLKTFQVIDVLSKLAGLWINNKKEVYYSQATHITFICPMLFDSFPLDTQVCKFQVGSYSYDMTKMLFRIIQLTFIQKQSIILDYNIKILNLLEKDKIFLSGALGNYSLAGFQMNLRRHVMSYIITYYLPSGLFVVVSWISFLIPPDIVPGRMALLITLFLVLINIFNNITTNSPKAEGLTAIEIWMLACILFVFGSLIEYAVILFRKQNKCKYGEPSQSALHGSARLRRADSMHQASSAYDGTQQNDSNYIYDSWAESYIRPTPSATAAASSPPLQQSPILDSSPIEATVTKAHHGTTSALYKYDPVVNSSTSKFPSGGVVENCVSTTANAVTTTTTAPCAIPKPHFKHAPPTTPTTTTATAAAAGCATTSQSGGNGFCGPQPQQQPSLNVMLNSAASTGNLVSAAHALQTNGQQQQPATFGCSGHRHHHHHHHGQRLGSGGGCGGVASVGAQTMVINAPYRKQTLSFMQNKNKSFGGPRLMQRSSRRDSVKRKRRQSLVERHYSTWHDEYASIDRFFLYCSPFLFFVFNFFYWGYFYVWALYFTEGDTTGQQNVIEMPDSRV